MLLTALGQAVVVAPRRRESGEARCTLQGYQCFSTVSAGAQANGQAHSNLGRTCVLRSTNRSNILNAHAGASWCARAYIEVNILTLYQS